MVEAHNRLYGPFSLPMGTHWAFPTNGALFPPMGTISGGGEKDDVTHHLLY